MLTFVLTVCLIAALPLFSSAEEPESAPFWLLPKVEFNSRKLTPADIKLVATPDRSRELGLLQVGMSDARARTARLPIADSGYRLGASGLNEGELVYSDGIGRFVDIPEEFKPLTRLQTNWRHAPVLDGRYAIVLATAKPCHVFLAVEEHALQTYKSHGAPGWLQEFAPTGKSVTTNETTYQVFVKQVPAGQIVLGPPCSNYVEDWMYFAFFAEAK